jgi:hypothetical protein
MNKMVFLGAVIILVPVSDLPVLARHDGLRDHFNSISANRPLAAVYYE